MKSASVSFFGMLLPEQSQRTDALQDVVLLAVAAGRIMDWRTRCDWKLGRARHSVRAALARRNHAVESTGKHLRQPRVLAHGDQAIGQSVEFLSTERAALLGGN